MLPWDPWPAGFTLRLPGPVGLVTVPVPAEDGGGLHDHKRSLPARPVPAKPDLEDPITALESGALDLLLIDIELLAKCSDFKQEVSPGPGGYADG